MPIVRVSPSHSRIAVVIPTYNRRKMLDEALASLESQALPDLWELLLVIVDDGSSDGTSQVLCERYRASDEGAEISLTERSWLIKRTNGERGAARNTGARLAIEKCRADWLIFFDSDDCMTSGGLKALLERIEGDEVATYGLIELWDGKNRRIQLSSTGRQGDLSEHTLTQNLLPLGATLVKASEFISLGGFSENRTMSGSEDWLFLCRLALRGKVTFVPKVVTSYRRHTANTHSSRYLESVACALAEIAPEVRAHWGARGDWAVRKIRRQALYAQMGALIGGGLFRPALARWADLICQDIGALREWRTYRMLGSLTRSAIRAQFLPGNKNAALGSIPKSNSVSS